MIVMQSDRLYFEPLTLAHADELFSILTTPSVLAFIDPTHSPNIEELRAEYAVRARGPSNLITPTQQWFNMAIYLKKTHYSNAIGRLEATSYGEWGELAYLLGESWWGQGLAFEAMNWWHEYLAKTVPETKHWWATVHPANKRSIKLLSRLEYEEADSNRQPQLQSYDFGDRCFVRIASKKQ